MKEWHQITLWDETTWAVILRRDPCSYCHGKSTSVEHVDPRGSRSTVSNGVGACIGCNNERGSVPLLFYLVWRATDRSESFKRWNWRLHPDRVRQSQEFKWRNKILIAEERARRLTYTLADVSQSVL